jgi:hypothetical protein
VLRSIPHPPAVNEFDPNTGIERAAIGDAGTKFPAVDV